jgi:dTDP-4-dehydrorhamnose 3,5-epimerase
MKGNNMGKITVETCEIEGLKIITPTVHGDARGYFIETYNYNAPIETTEQTTKGH